MTRSLVTGGAGFIGSHVAEHLLKLGHEVVVIDDLSGGFRENVPEGAAFRCLPISRADEVFDHDRFDYVFHLAAYAAEGLSHFIRCHNYENNVVGSMALINEAVRHGVKRFVFTSSIAVYGDVRVTRDRGVIDIAPWVLKGATEETPPTPIDPYGIAKYAVELDLAAAHEQFGLEYTIFRPHNVFGLRQNIADRYRNVVGIFMRQRMAGEPFTIFGDGNQVREFSYIDDVAPHIARSAEMPEAANEVFNIGAARPATVNALAGEVAAAFGGPWKIDYLPARHEAQAPIVSHEKADRVFGAERTVELHEGIRRMAEWAKGVGPRTPTPAPAIEVHQNLPPSWAA